MAYFRDLPAGEKFGFFTTPNYPDYEGGTPDDIGRLPTMNHPLDRPHQMPGNSFAQAIAARFTNTNISLGGGGNGLTEHTGLRLLGDGINYNRFTTLPKLSPIGNAKNLLQVRDAYLTFGATEEDNLVYKQFYKSFENVGINPQSLVLGTGGHTLKTNMSETDYGTGYGNLAGFGLVDFTQRNQLQSETIIGRETPIPFRFTDNKPELSNKWLQHTGKVYRTSLITSEFSYTPHLWDVLPDSLTPSYYSHIMLLNLTTQFYYTEEEQPSTSYLGSPSPVLAVSNSTVPFGIALCRRNFGNGLYLRVVAPNFPEFEEAVGEYFLGYAINHTPPGLIPPPVGSGASTQWGFDDIPLSDYIADFPDRSPWWNPLWRKRAGYILEVFFNEDRTHFTVVFNGEQLFKPKTLPTGLRNHITNRETAMIPTVFAVQNYHSTYDKTPPTGASTASVIYDHRLEEFHNPVSFLTWGWDEGVDTQFPDFLGPRGEAGFPFFMNRPDGLNSAPPWANLGSGWRGINRSALWQRNNAR